MDVERAIRERRTTKDFAAEPVELAVVRELVELATWAPDHNLSQRWRFRLLGDDATRKLVDVAPPEKKAKMQLAPTRLLVSVKAVGDQVQRAEDLLAVGAAVQNLMLAATARGLASFWQSPTVAGLAASRSLLGIPEDEQLVAVVNLGAGVTERPAPARLDVDDVFVVLP